MYSEAAGVIRACCHYRRSCDHCKGRFLSVAMCNTIFLLVVLIGELVFDDELTPTISGIRLLFNDVFNNTSFSDYVSVLNPPQRQNDVSKECFRHKPCIEVGIHSTNTSSSHQPYSLYAADRAGDKVENRARDRAGDRADAIQIRPHLMSFVRPESRDVFSHSPLQFSKLFKVLIGLSSGAEVQGNFGNQIQAVAKHGIYCHLHALREISEQYEDGSRIHVGCGYI